MRKLHIILSCTARKRGLESGYPRLRSVGQGPVSDRVAEWTTLVATTPRRFVAEDLYAGEYWQTGMELASYAEPSGQVSVSVVSAGLGLVGVHDKVPMYGATLATRHPDSVLATSDLATSRHIRRQWWDELTRAEALHRDGPRRLVDLEQVGSASSLMVCVGRGYLDAVASDLIALIEHLGDSERVMIFASGEPLAGLEKCWVAVSGSLRLLLGGSLSSTNLRAAQAVLAKHGNLAPNVDEARSIVATLTAMAGGLPYFQRRRQRDDVILDWIQDHLVKVPSATKTASLRRFRDEGNACEQARFGRLFDYAREMRT